MDVKMGVSAVSLQPRQGLVRDFAGAFYGSSLLTPVRIHQQLSVCQPLVDLRTHLKWGVSTTAYLWLSQLSGEARENLWQ
jgi:hypothetical protein